MMYLQEIVQLIRYEKMTCLVAVKRQGCSYTRREGIWRGVDVKLPSLLTSELGGRGQRQAAVALPRKNP